MIDEMFEMAQKEYQRQYDEWLKSKPDQKSIMDSYERLIELVDKYKKKTVKERGSS